MASVQQSKPPDTGPSTFEKAYAVGKPLGTGDTGHVYECTNTGTNQRAAVKVLMRRSLTPLQDAFFREEVSILQSLNHPNIVQLYDFYEKPRRYFLVMELCEGGHLLDRIIRKENYCEAEARDTVRVLFEALEYCHAHNVVHRDLKPENLLLVDKDDDTRIKLGDFGFAGRIDHTLTQPCGSPDYAAPEILNGSAYGKKVDVWSAGVIAYVLLGGYNPWQVQVDVPFGHKLYYQKMFKIVKNGEFDFKHDNWRHVSDEAKDFIRRVVVLDPDHRPTAPEALQHPWMGLSNNPTLHRSLSGTTLAALRKYVHCRKLYIVTNVVMACNYLKRMAAVHHDPHHHRHAEDDEGAERHAQVTTGDERSLRHEQEDVEEGLVGAACGGGGGGGSVTCQVAGDIKGTDETLDGVRKAGEDQEQGHGGGGGGEEKRSVEGEPGMSEREEGGEREGGCMGGEGGREVDSGC